MKQKDFEKKFVNIVLRKIMTSKLVKKEMAWARCDFAEAKALIVSNKPYSPELRKRLEKTARIGWSICHRNTACKLLAEEPR